MSYLGHTCDNYKASMICPTHFWKPHPTTMTFTNAGCIPKRAIVAMGLATHNVPEYKTIWSLWVFCDTGCQLVPKQTEHTVTGWRLTGLGRDSWGIWSGSWNSTVRLNYWNWHLRLLEVCHNVTRAHCELVYQQTNLQFCLGIYSIDKDYLVFIFRQGIPPMIRY